MWPSEAMAEATHTRRGYDREMARLKKIIEKLENEMQECKGQTPSDRCIDSLVISFVALHVGRVAY